MTSIPTPGTIIQQLIWVHGTNQVKLARDMGFHPRHVHNVCRERKIPSVRFVVQLAKALDIEADPIWVAISMWQLEQEKKTLEYERQRREMWAQETRAG